MCCSRGHGTPQYSCRIVCGTCGRPLNLVELVVDSGDTLVLQQILFSGPWAAAIPPWVGRGVSEHPYTSTELFLGPVGGPIPP